MLPFIFEWGITTLSLLLPSIYHSIPMQVSVKYISSIIFEVSTKIKHYSKTLSLSKTLSHGNHLSSYRLIDSGPKVVLVFANGCFHFYSHPNLFLFKIILPIIAKQDQSMLK